MRNCTRRSGACFGLTASGSVAGGELAQKREAARPPSWSSESRPLTAKEHMGTLGHAHAGWLVSASDGMMNLWECSGSGGSGGEPSLQVMHSQATDLNVRSMAHDARSHLLLCTGAEEVRRVNLHSLDAEVGFLEPRGTVKLQVSGLDCLCMRDFQSRVHHRAEALRILASCGFSVGSGGS
jgi:hypothetical protein